MMQFKIPQNVQQEDKIVGPLTLKQLIICGVGGGIAYSIYVMFNRVYEGIGWAFLVIPIAALTIAFAFVKIYNVTFAKFLFLFVEMTLKPRRRVWKKASAEIIPSFIQTNTKTSIEKKEEKKGQKAEKTLKNLQNITRIVDTRR